MIETLISTGLAARVDGFDMGEFMRQLAERDSSACVPEELLEMLLTLGSFLAFKQLMLEHKEGKAMFAGSCATTGAAFDDFLSVVPHIPMQFDDDEDDDDDDDNDDEDVKNNGGGGGGSKPKATSFADLMPSFKSEVRGEGGNSPLLDVDEGVR
jgi:hypothetical protein